MQHAVTCDYGMVLESQQNRSRSMFLSKQCSGKWMYIVVVVVGVQTTFTLRNNNNNDRLTAFDPGQPG